MNRYYCWVVYVGIVLFAAGCAASSEATYPETEHVSEVQTAPKVQMEFPSRIYPVVEPGRFDNGKMWTFEHAPADYFEEEYNLTLTDDWITQAMRGSVRLPNCTGSFVSSRGLILTNHHCTREEVTAVTQNGENLAEEGFYAVDLSDERRIPDFYVDQVIAIEDVTEEIYAALEGVQGRQQTVQAIEQARQAVADRIDAAFDDESVFTDVVALYNGALYSAYTFKRYDDIRLVMAPELEVGYFGGDPDNFTYPRYTLDMAFLRAYENDEPLHSEYYFNWSQSGSAEGDAVFVVGNPGSTSRLYTVAQLEYTRDVSHPAFISLLEEVVDAFIHYESANPVSAARLDLRNYIFQIQNAIKAYTGGLETLEDDFFMGRRMQSELAFINELSASDELMSRYGNVLNEIEDVVIEKSEVFETYYAMLGMNAGTILSSGTLQRAMLVGNINNHLNNGNEEAAGFYLNLIPQTIEWPEELERKLMLSRFARIKNVISEMDGDVENPVAFSRISGGLSPEDLADLIMAESALMSVEGTIGLIQNGVDDSDPAVLFGALYGPVTEYTMGHVAGLEDLEDELNRRLGRARYEVYGTSMPPDATFSIRLQDGRVAGYDYNGTIAPAYTTFYGMLDRHFSHGEVHPWSLPYRWRNLPDSFDLSAKLNLVTTNDIIGGNSGSPLLSRDLNLVGLIFDGNIESLSGDFIYTDDSARAISVDSRGMLEALRYIYGADRIVRELVD
ncbi:MAG: S46 family peptidase [Balneolia bacterium]|nr:S46 family peptidase [Balneolia bacterium]